MSEPFFAANFQLLTAADAIDKYGWTAITDDIGVHANVLKIGAGGLLYLSTSGTSAGAVAAPVAINAAAYTVTCRAHSYGSPNQGVRVLANISSDGTNYYFFEVGAGFESEISFGKWPTVHSTTPLTLADNADLWLRMSVDATDPLNVVVKGYSSADGYTFTQLGTTLTDSSSPNVATGVCGFSILATAASTTTTGVHIGDLVVSNQPTWTTATFNTANTAQPSAILSPSGSSAAESRDLVVYIHGAGDDHTALTTGTGFKLLQGTIQAVMTLGMRFASCDAHGDNWGNQSSLDDYVDLVNTIRATYGVRRIYFYAGSMGGLDAMSLVSKSLLPIRGAYMIYPALNLAWLYGASFTAAIDTAYGITGTPPNTYALLTAGYDPILNAPATYRGIPMRLLSSPSDTTVDKINNSDAFAALVGPYATTSVLKTVGAHGDLSNYQPQDVYNFFGSVNTQDTILAGTGKRGLGAFPQVRI